MPLPTAKYKTTQDVLHAFFALPSDSESEDDEEASDGKQSQVDEDITIAAHTDGETDSEDDGDDG